MNRKLIILSMEMGFERKLGASINIFVFLNQEVEKVPDVCLRNVKSLL